MLTPISRTVADPAPALAALVTQVNGIRNPDLWYSDHDNDPRFDQFATIIAELTLSHRLDWVQDSAQGGRISLVIDEPRPEHAARVRELRVAYSGSKPDNACIAVEFRGGWFYIDERDMVTRQYFKLLGGLWSLTMANAAAEGPAAPLLTVPVSR
jgi:hypothetical protein